MLARNFNDRNDRVVVVFSSSDYFVPYLGVAIKSIINTCSSKNKYELIVLECNISQQNKEKILGILKDVSNITLRFFNVQEYIKRLNFYIPDNRISKETYYGLFAPWILVEYDKAILLNSDVIVKRDIADLFNEDISNFVAGGVRDIILDNWLRDKKKDIYIYYTEYLKIKDIYKSFNGGVILIDFEKYRKIVPLHKIFYYINSYKFRIVDQDIFNILLEKKVKNIDIRWNYINNSCQDNIISNAEESFKKLYFNSETNPYIIHYAGHLKPWDYPDINFAYDFWKVAKQTPYYELIIKRMFLKELENQLNNKKNRKCHFFLRKLEKIFSVTNKHKYKVITILGLEIKMERHKRKVIR